jgi:hypothetical protein
VIAGSLEGISEALRIILNKIRMLVVSDYRIRPPGEMGFLESNPPQLLDEESLNVDISVRAVVPNSAVSCIIGRGGEVIKDINRRTGAVIRIGDRLTIVHERIVQISGSLEQCHAAVHEVLARIQTDKNLKEHLNVVYTKAAMQSNRPPPILSSPTGSSETAPPGVPPPINIPPSVGASPIQTDVMSPSTPIPRSLIQTPSVQIPASSGSGLIHQVQTPSGPMPVNIFADVVGPSMYSQPCAISLNLPPGTISTSLFRKVEAQTGAQIRFRQQTGSVNVSGPFSAVHCAHILLLKETSGSGSPSTMSPPASPPSTFPPTATPSPVGGFHRHLRSTSSTTREDE